MNDSAPTNPIRKAGIIILRPGVMEPEALLLFRGYHNDWSFPKGHCEAGESLEETALREIQEETGLTVEVRQRLPDMQYKDSKQEDVVVAMYLGAPSNADQKERVEYDTDRLEWITLSNVGERLSYQNLKDYFHSVEDQLLRSN